MSYPNPLGALRAVRHAVAAAELSPSDRLKIIAALDVFDREVNGWEVAWKAARDAADESGEREGLRRAIDLIEKELMK